MDKLEWSALEYEEKSRSRDWFWALSIIIVTSSIAAIIYENYFFAAFLILGGILLIYFAIKKPDTIFYELNSKGLKVKAQIYPYENIKAFWVQAGSHGETEVKSMLFLKSERAFMPIIEISIPENLAEKIHLTLLSKNIPEEEMKEHPSFRIIESLGF